MSHMSIQMMAMSDFGKALITHGWAANVIFSKRSLFFR